MKKLKLYFVILLIIGGAQLGRSQLILDEGFESECSDYWHSFTLGCQEDWINVSGSTDTKIRTPFAYAGNRSANFWVRKANCVASQDFGEGIAYNYNFRAGCTYFLSFAIARKDVLSAQWILANDLASSPPSSSTTCAPHAIIPPIPTSAQVLNGAIPAGYTDLEWIYIEDVPFTPLEDYNHLWFRISNLSATTLLAGSCFLDAVKIEQQGTSCPPIIDFELPEYACIGDELILENNSQNYNAYGFEICRINELGSQSCIPNTTVSSGDWTPGTFNTIDLEAAYQQWNNGQNMYCGLSSPGMRFYKVSLYLKNDSGLEVLEKEVTISCAPIVDVEIPEIACEGNPVPVIDNSLYYSQYKFNICRVGANDQCLSPGGNYLSSGWIDGPIGDLDLAQAYNEWSKLYGHNWKLWCNSPLGPDARYKVAIALKDDCNKVRWQEKFITIECKPCDQFCSFDIVQFNCNDVIWGENKNQSTEDKAACYACFRIVGSGVVQPLCNYWRMTTDVNPNPKFIGYHKDQVIISYADNSGASSYTIEVFQCDQPGCENNSQTVTTYSLCGPPEPKDENPPIKTRRSAPELAFNIQPNPFTEYLELEFSGAMDNSVQVGLFDVNGKLMLNTEDLNAEDSGRATLNLETQDLPSGVYFLNFKSGNFNETRKLIKIE